MQIARIGIGDLDQLAAFLASCGSSLERFRYFSKRPLSVIQNPLTTLLGLDENQVPVAYGHLDPEDGVVWLGICVSDRHRGRGYGRLMMRALLDAARVHQVHAIVLTVDADNLSAIRLYEEFGFALENQTATTRRYRLVVSRGSS